MSAMDILVGLFFCAVGTAIPIGVCLPVSLPFVWAEEAKAKRERLERDNRRLLEALWEADQRTAGNSNGGNPS